VAAANQYRFGRHTEKLCEIEGQMSLYDFFNEAEAVHAETPSPDEPPIETITYKRKKPARKRETDLASLPVKVITHELSEEQLHEIFGDKWKVLPDEVYKRLSFQPAQYIVQEHHIKVYAGTDNQTIVRADRPNDLLRNSIATPSLVAGIMNSKYVNAVPLYRHEQELKRNGIVLSRQVMANWVIQCSERYLAVMYDWLHEQLYSYHVLQADETPDKRKEQRQLLVKPLVEDFFTWLKENNSLISDKTKTGKGFSYCLNQEQYLRYFLEDGEVPMDNNAALFARYFYPHLLRRTA